jgi:hypothetical protein
MIKEGCYFSMIEPGFYKIIKQTGCISILTHDDYINERWVGQVIEVLHTNFEIILSGKDFDLFIPISKNGKLFNAITGCLVKLTKDDLIIRDIIE